MRAYAVARAFVFALALGASGCTTAAPPVASARHAYTHAHVLRLECADPPTLNPMLSADGTVALIGRLTGAFLFRTDARGEPTVPELLTVVPTKRNGGIAADGRTITFHLRRGVVWSDGKPFGARDVVFSTKLILDPKTDVAGRDGFDLITSIAAPDDHTVVYRLRRPYSPYAQTFFSTAGANAAIVPEHLLAGKDVNTDPYDQHPVGIGPFVVREWRRGDRVVLARNPRYFRGAPKLAEIDCLAVSGPDAALALVQTHAADVWQFVPAHAVAPVRAVAGIRVGSHRSAFVDELVFNLRRPAVADRAVRAALRADLDRPALVRKARLGLYETGETIVPPSSGFHDDLPLVPFDPAGAARMLDAAGWTRPGGGIRTKAGRRLSVELATVGNSVDLRIEVEMIRAWWSALGVELDARNYQPSLFFAPANQGGIAAAGRFDAAIFATAIDPNADLASLFGCGSIQNAAGYCDAQLQAAIDRGHLQYDRADRVADMRFIQQRIDRDVPVVVLDTRNDYVAYDDDLRGFDPAAQNWFDDMLRVDI